ncbi:MAG: tetratricopeptide repeat protein [Candidatus Aegiribacteria sp.]|nr:tetratricopeptide repeat protein [Candidatus Aegiribacteria sp.]MBD3294319.1 tetratricopeptide repeat protein [Candidatus Fermentibacteria bacterium]
MSEDLGDALRAQLLRHTKSEKPVFQEKGEMKPGERREISVLFLDLGGFTALSENLDHEAVHHIAKSVMDVLVDISKKYGGYVDKIEGDRIMVLFGARKASENDPERAVSCAFMMLDAVDQANEILSDTGVPITARVGINSGPVTVAPDAIGHLTAMGSTVNLASRMEESASINTIHVPEQVMERCRDLFAWEDLGKIELKGISNPVRAYRPTGSIGFGKHRWERFSKIGFSSFVGRRDEIDFLSEILDIQRTASTGTNRMGGVRHIFVDVCGDAGIGKSRLVHEFVRNSTGIDTKVIIGRSQSYAQPAYTLWKNLLRDLLGIEETSAMDYSGFRAKLDKLTHSKGLDDSLPFLAEQLSIRSGDRRLAELDSKAIALETHVAFRNLIKNIAEDHRVILILDDLQWIDSSCRKVLEFMAENCSTEHPILFFLIHRPEKEDGKPVGFDVNPGYVECRKLHLHPMQDEDCQSVAREMLSSISAQRTDNVSPEALRLIISHAQGNPFFLEELVLDMVESDKLMETNGSWVLSSSLRDTHVPSSISGLMQSRVDRLSEELKRSLQKASVLGFDFKIGLYRGLVESLAEDEDITSNLTGLENRQLLVKRESALETVYAFRHLLLHDTVYHSVLASNRKLLHRITAQLLEKVHSGGEKEAADLLAHHWEKAGVREKAIEWGILSLQNSVESYRHARALSLSEKLENWILLNDMGKEEVCRLLEVLMSKKDTLELLGRRKEQEDLLLRMEELAEEYDLVSWLGRIISSLGSVFRMTGRLKMAEEYYMKALQMDIEEDENELRCRVLTNLGMLKRIQGDNEKARECFEKALELNMKTDKRKVEGIILGNLGNLYFNENEMDKAIEYYRRSLSINREMGDRRSEGIALGNLGNPYMSTGDIDQALKYYRQALELHREIGNRRSEGVTLGNMGVLFFDHDRYDESRDCYRQALVIHQEVGNRRMEAITLSDLALLRIRSEDREGALDYYLKALEIIDELGLSRRGFDHFQELYSELMDSGISPEQAPRPQSWP